jgi:hypothetical protein
LRSTHTTNGTDKGEDITQESLQSIDRHFDIVCKSIKEFVEDITLLDRLVQTDQEITDISGEVQNAAATLGEMTDQLSDEPDTGLDELPANIENCEESGKCSLDVVCGFSTDKKTLGKCMDRDRHVVQIFTGRCRKYLSKRVPNWRDNVHQMQS